MTNATSQTRSEELRQATQAATAELDAARDALGLAVADGADAQATDARADVARLEQLLSELNAARPIALRREAEQRQAEAEKAQRERERAANANRKQRIAAAQRVDKLLAQLGRAYGSYLSADPGGTGADAGRLARRSRSAIASALLVHAPELADALNVRRVMREHRQSLEDAQASITEFAE